MAFTYDLVNWPQGSYVRMLVADTDFNNPVFSDDEVNAALFLESSQNLYVSGMATPSGAASQVPVQVYSYYRAAALLLDSLAANKARLAAINELLDVHLTAEKASQELRATAKEYRDTEANAGHFAIAEMVGDIFQARERVWKQLLRLYGA
jgi:hypothetical protein